MIYLKISIPLKVKVDISLEIFLNFTKHLSINMKKETLTYINLIFLKIILYNINNIKSPISLKTYKFKKTYKEYFTQN